MLQKANPTTFEASVASSPSISTISTGRALVGVGAGAEESIFGRAVGFVERLTDGQLALLISTVLFALTAWPLALTEVPPFQDLPNHLAAVTVLEHPESYPDLVSNGFLKTNSALFTWLFFVGKVVGTRVAARLFALLVLGLNAIVLPKLVLTFTGSRKKLVIASFLMWPMIHNWFVSMGMLDFALGVPLSLSVLIVLEHQGRAPSWKNVGLISILALLTWYAHVCALMVVSLLVGIHIVTRGSWKEAFVQAKRMLLPLAPSIALVLWSLYDHVTEPVGEMSGYVKIDTLLPPWELFYNLWAEWLWGFTKLSISSFLVAAGLFAIALVRRRESPMFFSPLAFLVLAFLYFFSPYIATNWFHVNSRLIPFLWMCALLRVPDALPKKALALLGVGAVLYSLGMGVDYLRLDKDRQKFTAGLAAVPQGAQLLPLIFTRQLTSENTRSLLHEWGFYVEEKRTSAPLLFAHSRSFPVMYRSPPPLRFNHLVLESFAPSMRNSDWMCNSLRSDGGIFVDDCELAWRGLWAQFWRDALPRYDHVLTWDATPQAQALVPKAYRVKFRQDRLTIYERVSNDLTTASR